MSTPAAVRVWGSNWALYRHMWRADAAGNLLQPLLYLLGMGIGVGALVDASGQSDRRCSVASATSPSSPRR